MQLDDQPPTVLPDSRSAGHLSGRSVCFLPDLAATQILQLENRSGGRGSGCIQTGLITLQGVCQSPLVFNPLLPQSSSCSEDQANTSNPLMAIPSLVPSGAGDVRGHTPTAPESKAPHLSSPRAGVSNAPMPQPGCMAYLRESFSTLGVSPEASALLLSSWRPKTQSSYNSAFAKWASWCHKRNRDIYFGPIEDGVNFLSELFRKGYQYCSLNSYRSAIPAVHCKVDGYSVGQHPLVSRLLKGVFNKRPPLSRYSSFWNVNVVLAHLKGLGSNGSLSLKILTLKTVMLMALAHPARSADLASMGDQSITDEGIVFLPRHLSKQSRPSKPLQDFFYPRFLEDEILCPVQTLLVYEDHTAAFRLPQLFFFFHGLENTSQYPVVPLLDG